MNGDFEILLTAPAGQRHEAEPAARRDGLPFRESVLDRGHHPGQPMITIRVKGDLSYAVEAAHDERTRLRDAGVDIVRVKIRTAVGDVEEADSGYCEQHLRLRLPDVSSERLAAIGALVEPHGARLSRNERRPEERFVTRRAGRDHFERLRDVLAGAGHEIAEFEEHYVVQDTTVGLDGGWLHAGGPRAVPAARVAGVESVAPGPPVFGDSASAGRWYDARRVAMYELLRRIASTPYGKRMVLCTDSPGLRLRYPIAVDGLPDTAVMVDVIFGTGLAEGAQRIDVAPGIRMLAMPPEPALAAKPRWLETDVEPRAKDLYDATLLAERTSVDPEVVDGLLLLSRKFSPYAVERWAVGWEGLRREHPQISGDLQSWKQRLMTALWRSYGGKG